jgi:hypothetical protein
VKDLETKIKNAACAAALIFSIYAGAFMVN